MLSHFKFLAKKIVFKLCHWFFVVVWFFVSRIHLLKLGTVKEGWAWRRSSTRRAQHAALAPLVLQHTYVVTRLSPTTSSVLW